MNIDKTFCVSDCKNWDCDRMLGMTALRIAERRGKEISQADLKYLQTAKSIRRLSQSGSGRINH